MGQVVETPLVKDNTLFYVNINRNGSSGNM